MNPRKSAPRTDGRCLGHEGVGDGGTQPKTPDKDTEVESNQLRRDMVDAALVARYEDDQDQFNRIWSRMNRLEKTQYDIEEWESELKKVEEGQRFPMSFTEMIRPEEELKRLAELEQITDDPITLARIDYVRRTRCFCPRPYLDEE